MFKEGSTIQKVVLFDDRIASIVFVEPILPKQFPTGSTIAGDDAAIHSGHNNSSEETLLVTVHVYSPPLSEFRQFVVGPVESAYN
jgi:hypothetical protein